MWSTGLDFIKVMLDCKFFWKRHKLMLISYSKMNIPKNFCCLISKGTDIRLASQATRSLQQMNTIKEYDCQVVACNKQSNICRLCFRCLRESIGKAFARRKLWITHYSLTLTNLRLFHEQQIYFKCKKYINPSHLKYKLTS